MLQKYHSKLEIILTCIAVEGFLLYGMLSTVCEDTWQSTGVWWNYFLLGIYGIVAVKVILQKNNWIDWCMIIGLVGLAEISRITTQTNAVVWFVKSRSGDRNLSGMCTDYIAASGTLS